MLWRFAVKHAWFFPLIATAVNEKAILILCLSFLSTSLSIYLYDSQQHISHWLFVHAGGVWRFPGKYSQQKDVWPVEETRSTLNIYIEMLKKVQLLCFKTEKK